MNIHQAKRINRCKEITFALKRIGGANSAGKGKYYATMGHGTDPYSRESIDLQREEAGEAGREVVRAVRNEDGGGAGVSIQV